MEKVTLKELKFILEEVVKEQVKDFITKDDAKSFATKDDLKNFATRDDLKEIKDDLKNFATKDDLDKFVTKEIFNEAVSTLLQTMEDNNKEGQNRFESVVEYKDDNMRIYNDRYNELKLDIKTLDLRVRVLEVV